MIGKTLERGQGRRRDEHDRARLRSRVCRRDGRLRARIHRRDGPRAVDPRPHGAGPPGRRGDPGRLRRRPRHHRPQGRAELARRARESAAIDHGRRARAGRLHRSRRALPVRQPRVPAVLRVDRRGGRFAAAARRRRSRHLRRRAGDHDAHLRRGVGRVRPAGARRERHRPLDDDPHRAGRNTVRRRAGRVRPHERHSRAEAGAGSAARVRIRAAAHHGQRARARRLHRSRLPLSVPQSAQRGMAGNERNELTGRTCGRRGRRRAVTGR